MGGSFRMESVAGFIWNTHFPCPADAGRKYSFWMRYTYEFSHELGHVLTNWQLNRNESYKWFEVTLSEQASIQLVSRVLYGN